eukprot:gene10159-11836_t
MLLKNQTELSNISNEMRELQDKSISKNVKCTNRKNVVEQLSKTIKTVSQLQQKQQEFTLYRQAFFFLYKHTRKIARQLFDQYRDMVEKIYTSYYRNYVNFLEKLQIDPTTKNDLVGTPENKTKGFFSSKSNKLKIKSSIFTVESRCQILSELDESPLRPQSINSTNSASSNQIKYSYETIYRSLIFFILDLVSYETMFIKDYFLSNTDSSFHIFGKCESYFMENINSFITSTYDPIALLLITTTQTELTTRIFQQSISIAMTRLRVVFGENIDSIRNANIRDLSPIEENRPHYVIRRYAELIGSVSTLYEHLPADALPIVKENLDMMRAVMSRLIIKLSEEIKEKTNKSIFLLNNFDLILTILTDKDNPNNIDDKEYYTLLYDQESEMFAMEQLNAYAYFKRMIGIVKDLYPLINMYTAEEINHPQCKKEIHESILKDFHMNWRSGIEEMNVNVTQLFPNFKNGMKIFQMILDRLFTVYKHFTQIILKYFKALKNSPHFIPETEISYEIKKYY